MKSLGILLYIGLALSLSPALASAQSTAPPVPKPLAERVNLATHVFVGRAQRVRVRKFVGGKLRKLKREPTSTDYTSGVFEIEVIVEEVLFPEKWQPSNPIKVLFGGGIFSVPDTRKNFLAEKFVYLTRMESFGGETYFGPSYGWNLVEKLSKQGEVETELKKRVARSAKARKPGGNPALDIGLWTLDLKL